MLHFCVKSEEYDKIKDNYGNINDIDSQSVQINKVLSVIMKKDTIYMYKGRKEKSRKKYSLNC